MTDPVPTLDDPRWVRDQYADSDGLRARIAFWQGLTGTAGIDVVASEPAIREYVAHTRYAALAARLPSLPDGLRVTARAAVFVATTEA